MMIFVVDIFIVVRNVKRTIAPAGQANGKHRNYLQKQMLLLMLSSIAVFVLTTLPLAVAHMIGPQLPMIYQILIVTTSVFAITSWLQSLNYAVSYF
jgi:hypothetical protein